MAVIRVGGLRRAGSLRRPCALAPALAGPLLVAVALALLPGTAQATDAKPAATATATAATPTPSGLPDTPQGYKVDAAAALAAADVDPKVEQRRAELGRNQYLTASLESKPVNTWEVSYYVDGDKRNLVVVDGTSGEVIESWTGSAVSWPMARGKEGQFGHLLNAPWVWGPLAAIFLLCLLDFRRLRKWVHLDLLVLLSFGVSQAYFNAAEIGVSVPLYYPPLIYLLLRLLSIGFRGTGTAGGAREGLRPSAPRWLLIGLAVGLVVARIAANMADSGVIDVGYAGVIGADKITDARPIYGADSFPDDNRTGDTYGPANYFAYVPFEQLFGWSGSWDDLPAAHAAAVSFDLATIVGLYALGAAVTRRRREGLAGIDPPPRTAGYSAPPDGSRRAAGEPADARDAPSRADHPLAGAIAPSTGTAPPAAAPDRPGTRRYHGAERRSRGRRLIAALRAISPARDENALGLVLAFAWLAYPYSDFALQSNSNDALISALLVWALVLFASPLARGALLGTAALAKFAPLALAPLFAAGERGLGLRPPAAGRSRLAALRGPALFSVAFLAAAALFLAHPAVDPGLAEFYDRTVKSQLDRDSPFSIWGQADLGWLQTIVKAATAALAVLVAFVPRTRTLAQVAALGGAVMIAVELTLEHWFYLYIPWFLPLLLAAIAVTALSARSPD